MYIVFLVILLIPFVVMFVINALEKKPEGVVVSEKEQCKMYVESVAFLWGTALAVFIMCFIGKISLEELGFRPISFKYNIWFTVITLVLNGFLLIYSISMLILPFINPKSVEKSAAASHEGTTGVLPRTKKERWFYSLLAFSAGICEEIVFRGFLVFLLIAIFPSAPIYLVILISTVIFGVLHAYQGVQGIIFTGFLGLLFMCFVLVTDSLILAILLHSLFDFSSTFILSKKNMLDSKTAIQ